MKNINPNIKSIHIAACDINGIFRGKRIPSEQINKALNGEIRLPTSILGVDIWGQDIGDLAIKSGDADGIVQPNPRGVFATKWEDNNSSKSAMMLASLKNEDGSYFEGDSRHALSNIINRYQSLGLTPVIATELEFFIIEANKKSKKNSKPLHPKSPKTGQRLDKTAVLSIDELYEFSEFLDDIYKYCSEMNIPADAAISENGCGQFEVNLLHSNDPLKVADDTVLFKRIVKSVAHSHGFIATFMAKPFGEQSGSGLHIHYSLLNEQGENVFNDGSEKGSELMHHAIAGMLSAMPESTLLFAPHLNSYRRLAPNSHAPTNISWGYENRTTAIRIPAGSYSARRIEHRVAGADANPYLVISAILGAALFGIESKLKPILPVSGGAYSSNSEQLPADWLSAISQLEDAKILPQLLPPLLIEMIVACKKQEANTFLKDVTPFEYNSYLHTL